MQDFIKYIDWSILTNCPINCKDILNAENIWAIVGSIKVKKQNNRKKQESNFSNGCYVHQ